jgi:hypothetical protein
VHEEPAVFEHVGARARVRPNLVKRHVGDRADTKPVARLTLRFRTVKTPAWPQGEEVPVTWGF